MVQKSWASGKARRFGVGSVGGCRPGRDCGGTSGGVWRRRQHHMGLPNLAMLHRVQNGQKALADVRSQQGQPIQELTIGGSRADQHRRHWNRRSRTGISRPLGAGTGVVGLIEIPWGSPARRGAGPGVRTDRCSRSVPSAARRRQSVRHCGAGAVVSAAAKAASSSSERKKLSGRVSCA